MHKFKVLSVFFLLAACALVYQNCGKQGFQANGDPYENGDDGIISLPDNEMPGNAMPAVFVAELTCGPSSTAGKFKSVEFGSMGGVDALRLTDQANTQRLFSWNSVSNTYTLNSEWNDSLKIVSISLSNEVATVKTLVAAAPFSETFNCH